MTMFWKKWLNLWACAVTIFGIILALAAFPGADGLARAVFALFQNPLPGIIEPLDRFAIGLMGAVTMGWGMTLYAAFQAAAFLGPAHAPQFWRQITVVLFIWYAVDSAISVSTGYWLNAVSNTIFALLYLVAVVRGNLMHSV
jgi:hypothetical protein